MVGGPDILQLLLSMEGLKSIHFICPTCASPHDLRSQRVHDHMDEHVWDDHADVDYDIPGSHVLAQIDDQTDV